MANRTEASVPPQPHQPDVYTQTFEQDGRMFHSVSQPHRFQFTVGAPVSQQTIAPTVEQQRPFDPEDTTCYDLTEEEQTTYDARQRVPYERYMQAMSNGAWCGVLPGKELKRLLKRATVSQAIMHESTDTAQSKTVYRMTLLPFETRQYNDDQYHLSSDGLDCQVLPGEEGGMPPRQIQNVRLVVTAILSDPDEYTLPRGNLLVKPCVLFDGEQYANFPFDSFGMRHYYDLDTDLPADFTTGRINFTAFTLEFSRQFVNARVLGFKVEISVKLKGTGMLSTLTTQTQQTRCRVDFDASNEKLSSEENFALQTNDKVSMQEKLTSVPGGQVSLQAELERFKKPWYLPGILI